LLRFVYKEVSFYTSSSAFIPNLRKVAINTFRSLSKRYNPDSFFTDSRFNN